jgi:hypothetical protein
VSDDYGAQVRRQLAEARDCAEFWRKATVATTDQLARTTSAWQSTIVEARRQHARAERAEADLAALHAGEEPYEDDRVVPIPGQWIWQWNRATQAERLSMAAYRLELLEIANRCQGSGMHRTRLAERWDALVAEKARAEQAEQRIAAVRALHYDDYGICMACSGSHGVPWPCPTITALDGAAEQQPPAVNHCCELCPCTGAADQSVCSPCCACGSTAVAYRNYREQPFCAPCADGNRPTCPLGDKCSGVDCDRRAEHGPRRPA